MEPNDVSMDVEPSPQPNQENPENMTDQNFSLAPPPATSSSTVLQRNLHFPPDSSARKKPLPFPEDYLTSFLHGQIAEMTDKVVTPALRNAVDAMLPAMIDRIAGEIKGISACSHSPPSQKHHVMEEDDSEPEDEYDLKATPRRKRPGKRGTMNHLHVSVCFTSFKLLLMIPECISHISQGEKSPKIQECSPAPIPASANRSSF